ncbi:hypothetical protein MRS76_01415 [Rhizobiaceae bacterium n13]|uniref:Uncharacterized protein n=1 Tax=Ferirhizobium litorale TaxID=2927786 RepID=A0AAE3QBU6_9HYPH|nr:hypothetical protein [Fererhizobium litorale]MDI7860602.1 hypothetical protein [Fererhizobium litorale]MDI7920750.1 hypothetical protein [Fererhizobium litorale]
MSADDQKDPAQQSAFYGAQYGRFGSSLAAQIRIEAYGVDMGQQGWRTEAEHRDMPWSSKRWMPICSTSRAVPVDLPLRSQPKLVAG